MPKKKRKIKERIAAGTMAVLLALTGSFAPASGEPKSGIPTGAFGSGPIPAYAAEINTSAAAISTKAEQSQSATSVLEKTQSDLTKAGKTQSDLTSADKTQADISGTETLQSNSTGAEDSRYSSTGIETIQSNPTGTADLRYAATRTETVQFDPTGAKEFQSGAIGTEALQSDQTGAKEFQSGAIGIETSQADPTGAEASRSNQTGTEAFNAALGGIKKYFMKLGTRAFQTVTPGESLADATTSVSFDAADGYYYLVRLRPEPDTDPEKPDTAVQALDNGWIRKIGSGAYVWQNLSWNRTYDVYELNLSAAPTELRKLGSTSTNTGKIGGTLSIEGDLLTGSKIKAVIENPTTEAGDWSWYTADSTGATVWTPCTDGAAGAELTIPASAAGSYLKAVFTASTGGDFEGSLEIISSLPAASALTGTAIAGAAAIGEQLTASALPEVCELGVRYEWYRTSSSALESAGGQFLYTGNPYSIQAEDIGNRLYVKAVSLPDSVSAGESVSALTEVVRSVPYDAPYAPEIKKTGATALTVAMPSGTDTAGLYEFGYSTQPTPDKTGSDFHTVTAKARGTGEVTIPELASSTVYYIWARRSGEGGFTDSPWSAASASGATLPPALTGGLTMIGSCIYGETLTVSLTVPGQNGSFHWYRDGAELTEAGNPSQGDGTSSYQLGTGDIGKQLTVTYQGQKEGTGSPASGSLTMVSDPIEKKSQTVPAFSLSDSAVEKTDSSLTFTIPAELGKKLKAGYAYSSTGVPASRGAALNPGDQAVITGLDRNTDYYLFLKYAESDTEKESGWSAAAGPFTTEKRSLSSATIVFNLTDPHPGNQLTATLTSSRELGEIDGTWSWAEVVGGVTTPVAFMEDIETPEETSYMIPDTAVAGTRYTVTFTGKQGMDGTVTETSGPVTAAAKVPYPTPSAPQVKTSTDASLTVAMPSGTEGIYQFSYGNGTDGGSSGWVEIGNTAYGSNTVIITGLVRNTDYYVRAKRLSSESGYTDSEWSAPVRQKTGLTELGGSVVITGNAVNGELLTASYTGASYLPSGDDTGGSFRWQKALSAVGFVINGKVQEPVYTDIPGAAANTYQLTQEDVNYKLKAIYTAPSDHGFTGEKSAETDVVKKTPQTSPQSAELEAGSSSADQVLIRIKKLPAGGWYQIRTRSAEAPTAPELSEAASALGWKTVTAEDTEAHTYYNPTSKTETEMNPGTEYIIYTVYAGTAKLQPSAVVAGTSLTAGYYQQTGSIVYASGQDAVGGIILSGGELKAELTGGNGTVGSWKWYVSTGLYSSGAPGNGDWTYLPSGYYPINNSTTSTLTLTDDMLGKYVRAEFVADPSGNYEGTVGTTGGGEEYYPQYIKKIYKETLKLESNQTNGLGEPMAYAGCLLTGTIENYAESGGLDNNRTTVELLANGVVMTGVSLSYSENTFTCTLTRNQDKAGQTITARVSKPKNLNLYVTEALGAVDGTALSSDTSTGTSLMYKDGIPISTTEDFEALMSAGSAGGQSFASRTETYVLTENINCVRTISIPSSTFNGVVDGDYHTITNIKNPMFYKVGNSTVQNIIFNKADVNTLNQSASDENSAAIIAKTADGGTTVLRRLFLSQADIRSAWDAAYFIGKTIRYKNTVVNMEECGSAGGSITLKTDKSAAGMVGFVDPDTTVTAESVFSYGTQIDAKNGNYGGIAIVLGIFIGKDIVCASVGSNIRKAQSGGVAILLGSGSDPASSVTLTNSYYDSTLTPSSNFPTDKPNGTPKETKELIGYNLENEFTEGTWVYAEGYYPRLSWLKDDPVANLFAATRGAFTSVDGTTLSDDMFEGKISGPIEIPQELQREGYTFEATGDLSVEESGLITPTGTGGGTITIYYGDDLYSAQNSYTFNTSAVPAVKKSFQSVTLSETDYAQIGTVLTAEAQLDSTDTVTDPGDITYQWYKRANGSTVKELITGTVGNTYTIKPTDAGYSFMAMASAAGYWDGGTGFTNTVTMTAPSSPPDVSVDDYQTATVTGKGGLLAMYEFAYSRTAAGEKTVISYDSEHPVTQTITGLEANADYWFFSRVAPGQGYSASPWSAGKQVTMKKIPLEGNVTLNDSQNVDTVLTAVMDDKNLQTGTWKIERVSGGTVTELTADAGVPATIYETRYTLKAADVGSKIRFTFTANGKFSGSASAVSGDIEQAVYTAPATAPALKIKTDTTVTLEAFSGTVSTDLTTYEYGCQVGSGTITALNSNVEAVTSPAEEAGIRVRGLSRNTSYSFYVRRRADAGHVASNWSPALAVATEKTDISTNGPLVYSIGGAAEASAVPTVEDVIRAAAPSGIAGLTGSWSLEKESEGKVATLSGYTTAADGLSISYTLGAQDAGYTIRAVFKGTGDFTGEIRTSMAQAVTERRYPTPGSGTFTVSGQTDTTMIVRLAEGLSGSYQFGKRLAGSTGTVEECAGSVQQGNAYTVTGLERNTAYEIFVRRRLETGYLTSGWSAAVAGTTAKTEINGDIQITGTVEIGALLTAVYQGGHYTQNGLTDDKGGTYTWKAGDSVIKTESGTQSTYKIEEGDRGKSISVIYAPPADSDFRESRTKLVGVVAKARTEAPASPELSPQNDGEAGSTLRVTNAVSGVWYLPMKYNGTADTQPDLVPESGAAAAGWVKATGTTLDFIGLAANTDYLIYGAHLETETKAASLLAVSAKTRTPKEEITKGADGSGSTGITGPATLKPMDGDGTKVSISVYGKAPTGTWNWYAAKTVGGSDGWKIIRSEKHGEVDGAAAASDTYQIPYEYSGYYLKIEFQADGDYTGQETWEPAGHIAEREITGAVTVTPDQESGNQRLFEKLTAAYEGSDDRSGTWVWYREDSGDPSGWMAIRSEFYTSAGPSSSYTPTGEDIGKRLKAVYTAASFGCIGSSEAVTGALAPAVQNQPAAPKVMKTSGTNITLADSDPGKAGPYGSRPEAMFGYRKVSEPESPVVWINSGPLASQLEPSTEYNFYTKYKETDTYMESESSGATAANTGAGQVYQSNLNLVYDTTEGEEKKLDAGRTVTAVYQGEGWDKGSFALKRSDGQVIATGYQEEKEEAAETIRCSYQLPLDMAGFSLIFTYTALEESGYSGSVEIKTGAVTKAAGDTPGAPVLEKHLDTDCYLANVTDGQEYAILKAADGGGAPSAPARHSSLWQILTADGTGNYRYTGLDRGTTYYVFTRTVETAEREVSAVVISNAVTTESYLYMGDLTLKNEKDLHTQPVVVSAPIEIPTTLNGNLTVESIRVVEAGGSGKDAPFSATESLSEFVIDEGGGTRYLNPNVYEKGSTWANGHFATTLGLSGAGGRYAELEYGEQSTFDNGDTMALSVYRANAVSEGGSYIWEITLRDDEGAEALLKAEVTIVTQLEFTVPLQIALQIKDQELLQTTNGAGLKNGNGMPVEVSVDEKPGVGANMPKLLGEPTESDPELMNPGAVYLRLSVDNSIETGQVTDLWLDTELPTTRIIPLVKLGASSQADYYISGIISGNGQVNWPWPSDGSRTIKEAYQLKFIYEISADGYPVYTPKISSPESITVP